MCTMKFEIISRPLTWQPYNIKWSIALQFNSFVRGLCASGASEPRHVKSHTRIYTRKQICKEGRVEQILIHDKQHP